MRSGRIALLLLATLGFSCLFAQDDSESLTRDQIDTLLSASQTRIDGKATPDRVPYHLRMRMFFDGFGHFEAELATLLSAADLGALRSFASTRAQARDKSSRALGAEVDAIGARAASMNAKDIASEIHSAVTRAEANEAAEYRRTIRQLSTSGQTAVAEFTYQRIRPLVVAEDPRVLAANAPAWYKMQIVGNYELMTTGQLDEPPTDDLRPALRSLTPESTNSSEGARMGVSQGGGPTR